MLTVSKETGEINITTVMTNVGSISESSTRSWSLRIY